MSNQNDTLEEIDFSKEAHIKKYLTYKNGCCCDLVFANIYLWSRKYPTRYMMVEDCLVFKSMREAFSCAFPLGTDENRLRAIPALEELARQQGAAFQLHLVTPEDFALLEAHFPGRYKIEYERDSADYVYETENLINLSGKKYHGKKNHINKFKKLYPDWGYETITDENVEDCFQMALKWRRINECDNDLEKRDEVCVTMNALRLLKELHLVGGLIRANGEVVAFSIGEPLTEDTFGVHIEKAFTDVPGAYPLINQQFLLHEAADYKYVNREEDTGAEGLRRAKESYHPAFMMEKGIVTFS